jgi:hypothetical protein
MKREMKQQLLQQQQKSHVPPPPPFAPLSPHHPIHDIQALSYALALSVVNHTERA